MSTALSPRHPAGIAALNPTRLGCSRALNLHIPHSRLICCGARKVDTGADQRQGENTSNVAAWAPRKGHHRMFLTTLFASGMGGILGILPDLEGPVSTLQAIGILCGIVAFHELGHFTAARVQGIHVSKFAIGFGPSLWSYKPGDVEYSVRAFPLGGFVAFPDNDEDCPYPADDPDLLKNRPIADRFWVISAGVIFNVILAFMVTVAQVQDIGYMLTSYNPGVRVPIVMKGSAADRYGIRPGDIVLALDNQVVAPGPGAVQSVVQSIKDHRDISIDFTVARPEGIQHVDVLPDIGADGKGKIGVQLQGNVDIERRKVAGPGELLERSSEEIWRLLTATSNGLAAMVKNFDQAKDSVSSPVAVVAVGSQVARESPTGLYSFAAVVNINLAVVNVLPLPALDGGYLLLLLIEAIRQGKKLPKELEASFMASGFLLLVSVGVFLIIKDTVTLLPKL
eukprot:jgi/Ulvmu1/3210/UM015_0251.1